MLIPYEDISYIQDPVYGKEMIDFTENFFIYLNNNPDRVDFFYDRVQSPAFQIFKFEGDRIDCNSLMVQSRKMKCAIKPGFEAECDLDLLYGMITNELNQLNPKNGTPSRCSRIMYFYKMHTTPTIFDPQNFNPRRGVILRYAEFPYHSGVSRVNDTRNLWWHTNLGSSLSPQVDELEDPIQILMRKIGYGV